MTYANVGNASSIAETTGFYNFITKESTNVLPSTLLYCEALMQYIISALFYIIIIV